VNKKYSVIRVLSAYWVAVIAVLSIGLVFVPSNTSAQMQRAPVSGESGDLEEAYRLNEEALKLYQQGKYNQAESLYKRSLEIGEKALGSNHPDVATSLNNLAGLYYSQGNYSAAEPLYKRSLSIREKALGSNHPDVATSLNNLAGLYYSQGNYSAAEPLYKRSLSIKEKALGSNHPDVAGSLNNLALLYSDQGNYSAAEPLLKRSLSIKEKALGANHPSVALSLNNLALLYSDQGNYSAAEPLLKRSLDIYEKALGSNHPNVASSLNNLAELYRTQGNYSAAEPLLKRSLSIREKALGSNHPDVAGSLNNLALLYVDQGNYSAAEPLYKRSLDIVEKALGSNHPYVATSLNNLANLYRDQGNYSAAEPLYKRSLDIVEKALGSNHPSVATSLSGLAQLYLSQGNYSAAEPLYKRSLDIYEKALGSNHPDVANSLNNLAGLYLSQGNYSAAEPLYKRSLDIWEKALGSNHPDVATSLNNLAGLYQALGDIPKTIEHFTRGLAVEDKNIKLIFAVGNEKRKQDYARTFTGRTDFITSLAINKGKDNQSVKDLALTTVLQRKGLVLDAVTDSIKILQSQEKDPEVKKLIKDWYQLSTKLSNAVNTGKNDQTSLENLENQKQELEEKISTKSATFREAVNSVNLASVQSKIPIDGALVEIVQYKPFNNKAKKDSENWGQPRYAAAVLRNQGQAQWVDLGDGSDIDKQASSFHNSLSDYKKPYKKVGNLAYQKLMKPIIPLLGNVKHILISPDGQLTQIPFEALIDDQGKFLVEKYQFSYLATGRDLVKVANSNNQTSPPLLIGGVDYSNLGTIPKNRTIASSRGSNKRSADLVSLKFDYLPGTLAEVNAIKGFLPNSQILSGTDASEEAIKQVMAPSILHLATHGFFLENKTPDTTPPTLDGRDDKKPVGLNVENPFLRSGIILAGFNKRNESKGDRDDGVLTAQEFTGINLRGTKLVVLSACETGKGDIRVGEGVYGLRRALTIAGAESQVISLWSVADEQTKDLMVKFYKNLNAGMGRHEALRQAQLDFIKDPNTTRPYFWAAFIPSGNWSPLGK
jgi:CHAT domain-containing protein/Flp pilus assembly protein TadD